MEGSLPLLDTVPSQPGLAPWVAIAVTILVSLSISAFLSFAETCLTSLSESRVHALMAAEGRRARALKLWLEQPHAVLVTILVGNTLANIVGSVVLAGLAETALGASGPTYVTPAMIFLILTFGEIIPKTLARQYAMRAAIPTIHLVRVVHYALLPATWLLSQIARVASRAMGVGEGRGDVSEAELEAMVDLGSREGTLAPAKAEQLRSVFRLYERSVREIMVPRTDLVALDLDEPPEAILAAVDVSQHSRLPCYRGRIDELDGVLHSKDLAHRMLVLGRMPTGEEIRALLREPLMVPGTMRLDGLLRLFRKQKQHLAVVLDEHGGLAGIVTLEDVLEELVGEIWDEHDEEAPGLVRTGPGRWTADGRLPLSELEERLGVELSQGQNYDTLAGLLMDVAGCVPKAASVYERGGLRFEVLTGDEKRVRLVRVTRISER